MAITTYNFNNSDYVINSGKRVITCTSTKATEPKFRFYLEVLYDSKTYAYTFRPNATEYGMIDIGSILSGIVQPIYQQQVLTVPQSVETTGTTNDFQQNIHSIPHQKYDSGYVDQYLSTGGTGCKFIQLKLWDFYALSSTTIPVKQGSSVDANLYVLFGANLSTDLINQDFSNYKLTNNSGFWLSGNYRETLSNSKNIDAAITDFGVMSFLNRTLAVNTGALTQYIAIKYYDTSGGITHQNFDQSNVYGGKWDASGVNDDSMIIYFGCYPANLNKLVGSYTKPSDITDLDYYEVYISLANGVPVYSTKYRFNIINRCDKFDAQRFAYINKFGVWEYITFDKKRTDKLNKKNTEINKSVYDYSASFGTYSAGYNEKPFIPHIAHESKKIVASNIGQSFTINTGFLKDYEIDQVRDMFLSPMINYINTDGSAIAVLLTNKNIDEVVVSHKYDQTEYALNFEYSIKQHNPILL